jgi:hypothetical protein
MNSKQWFAKGYKVIFRHCVVYLFEPGSERVFATPNDGGDWMNHDDLTALPWLDMTGKLQPEAMANFRATARDCYCYSGVNHCDFCNAYRTPEGVCSSNTIGIFETERSIGQLITIKSMFQANNEAMRRARSERQLG